MNNLKPYPKLYTQPELIRILRAEIVKALMKYNPPHEELKSIIKDIKKRYK